MAAGQQKEGILRKVLYQGNCISPSSGLHPGTMKAQTIIVLKSFEKAALEKLDKLNGRLQKPTNFNTST